MTDENAEQPTWGDLEETEPSWQQLMNGQTWAAIQNKADDASPSSTTPQED